MIANLVNFVVFTLAALLTPITPVARAQTDAELDAQNRIVTMVLGHGARARQLKEARAQIAEIQTALQMFLAQSTPVEREEGRKQLIEAVGQPHGQELLRAVISEMDPEQRSRCLLAANVALESPPSDGSSSGLTKSFTTARESLLGLLSLTDNDETAIQLGIGLVRQTQQGYLWRTGIVDGKELASQLLEGIELEAQRPHSTLTGVRKMLVLRAIYEEASRWVQGTSISEVERIYFATLMNSLMDYVPPKATPPPRNSEPQPQPSHTASVLVRIGVILAVAAVVFYRFRARVPWRDLLRKPESATASLPRLVRTLADLSEEDISGKRVLVRVDLDILDVDGTLTSMGPSQMQQTLAVVRELVKRRASKIILAAHTHRDLPMGYVRRRLEEVSDRDAMEKKHPKLRFKVFNKAEGGQRQEVIQREPAGAVILLDNLEADAREGADKPDDRASLAQELAELADVYINDAPNASQETRASTVDIVFLVPVVAVGPTLAAELQAIAAQPEKRRRSALSRLPAVTAMQRVGYL
jgi:Phosphoglycerate kinase